jgi:hypothetical protein
VLLAVFLILPILTACGGNGTDFVAQPQELAVLEDCSQASLYVDRVVAGLWNQLCPADPVPTPGVTFDLQTGEFEIRTTVRARAVHVHGFLGSKLSLVNGLQLGDVATAVFTLTADDLTGEGTIFVAPEAGHSLHVWGQITFENQRCEIVMNNLDFRGYAGGTNVRLWGNIPFETREFRSGDDVLGNVLFEPTELEDEPVPAQLDAQRIHAAIPLPEHTAYRVHLDPLLFDIFG